MPRSPSLLPRTLAIVLLTIAFFFLNIFVIHSYLKISQESPTTVIKQSVEEKKSSPIEDSNKQEKPNINLHSCEIDDPLAVNALSRVKTEHCRLKITDAACKLKNNLFHDKFPESECNNHDRLLVGMRVGCFADSAKNRSLGGFAYELKTDNSHEMCRAHCYRAGFLYYGVEFGYECFCGDSITAAVMQDINCMQYMCPGKNNTTCGGFNAIDVYRTGLREYHVLPKATYLETEALIEKKDSSNDTQKKEVNKPVKILFLLQLNGRNDRQVKRMLKIIYSPNHLYYIHVDQRQLYMLTEMKSVAAKLANVYVSPDGHSTIWGGASLLTMVQGAIRRSLSLPHFRDWDYLLNMSESDFPIMTLAELELQLSSNNGKSFLSSHNYNTARFIQRQGFDYVFLECEERMWRIGKRTEFPRNLRIDGGSDWIVLHREFAEYSVSNDELPSKMRKLFSSIILPVESFFHTLAYNSRFCNSIVSGNLRLTNWNRKQGCRCASLKKVVDWCGCSPLVYKKHHTVNFSLEKAKAKPVYLARKFESLIDIDAVAIAEKQAMRDRPHLIHPDHPSFNSTFVNFYKADIDGYSVPNVMLAKCLLNASDPSVPFVTLLRIDIFKAYVGAPHQMVFTIQSRPQNSVTQLLVERRLHSNIAVPAIVDGYELKIIQMGVNIDHKEEIFREITGYADLNSTPVIALRWVRVPGQPTTVNETKTSPRCNLHWKDGNGVTVATQSVHPYDSIYGTQFAVLELGPIKLRPTQTGIWTVSVHDPAFDTDTTDTQIAIATFPIYSTERAAQFDEMTVTYYSIKKTCRDSECTLENWSTLSPDPKSEISYGYDEDDGILI